MDDATDTSISIPAADVLRLIHAHLQEAGLPQTAATLRTEAGIGAAAPTVAPHMWLKWAQEGLWHTVLQQLTVLDRRRSRISPQLLLDAHEMAILELADAGEWGLAYATYRLVQQDFDGAVVVQDNGGSSKKKSKKQKQHSGMTRGRLLEQKLAALASARQKDPTAAPSNDFYSLGRDDCVGISLQDQRAKVGLELQQGLAVQQPKNRLVSLLQQAMKWQSYTGQLPRIREHFEDNDDNATTLKKKRKVFDLVLGQVTVDATTVGQPGSGGQKTKRLTGEPVATIKFGKKATAQVCLFLPDGSGLITGSSDGLVEIWDAKNNNNYSQLLQTLPYQQKEELLSHNTTVTALALSNDGTMLATGSTDGVVQVWNYTTGSCLRKTTAAAAVSALAWPATGTHLLVALQTGTCREFGLRTSKWLADYQGHSSYISSACYTTVPSTMLTVESQDGHDDSSNKELVLIVTSSGDGTVRLWHRQTAACLAIWGAPTASVTIGTSLVEAGDGATRPGLVAALPMHTPAYAWLLVARCPKAVLVDGTGRVVQTYAIPVKKKDAPETVFCTATVSPDCCWLYAVDDRGSCHVFDVRTGERETSWDDFAVESTRGATTRSPPPQLTAMAHHPHKAAIAALSNDATQKKGVVVVWT